LPVTAFWWSRTGQTVTPTSWPAIDTATRITEVPAPIFRHKRGLEGAIESIGFSMMFEGKTGRIDEAVTLARQGEFDIAILDVNLNGQPVTPVVEVLVERGVPFVFATGYGQRGVPEPYRQTPTLQKPFQSDALADAINTVMAGGKG
jgi:DNA-binding NarL/FixJ family response regulator